MERSPTRKIRDAMRLRASGFSTRKIAASLGVSQSTTSERSERMERAGPSWPLPDDLADAELERRLFRPRGVKTRVVRLQPDGPAVHRELRREGVTLSPLWEEHRAVHPDGHGHGRFCGLCRPWEGRLTPSVRQHHVAGARMFVDRAAAMLEVTDPESGETRTAQLLVAALGASNHNYAEASWTQGLSDWIGAHCRALSCLGGVPAQIASDNLKAGVTDACSYGPAVSRTYADMAAQAARRGQGRGADRGTLDRGAAQEPQVLLAVGAERGHPRAALSARGPRHPAISAPAAARSSESRSARRRSRCRGRPACAPDGGSVPSGSATASRSTSIAARHRTRSCASRSGCGSPRGRRGSSTAASGSRRAPARRRTGSTPPCATTCRRAVGATSTGRLRSCGAKPPASGQARRRR